MNGVTFTITYQCPICGEENETEIDPTAGRKQVFTEDRTVCCRPNVLSCKIDDERNVSVTVQFEG